MARKRVSDVELAQAVVREPSYRAAARVLGLNAATVHERATREPCRSLIREARAGILDEASNAVARKARAAVKRLGELMKSGTPQDSVALGAAQALLKQAAKFRELDLAEKGPEASATWADIPGAPVVVSTAPGHADPRGEGTTPAAEETPAEVAR